MRPGSSLDNPAGGNMRSMLYSQRLDQLQGPPSLLHNGYLSLVAPGVKRPKLEADNSPQLEPMLTIKPGSTYPVILQRMRKDKSKCKTQLNININKQTLWKHKKNQVKNFNFFFVCSWHVY
jgi:hypothetical protein